MPPEKKLIPPKEWMDRTSLVGRQRSAALKQLDSALADYDRSPSTGTTTVIARFEAWKLETGGAQAWRSSPRNQGKPVGAFTELEARLTAGDSDAGLGVKAGEAEHHRRARLGVLYLYSHMSVSTNLFGMLLDTASGVASGAFNFGLAATAQLNPKVESLTGAAKAGAQGGQKLLGGVERIAEKKLGNAMSGVVFGIEDPQGKKIVVSPKNETEQTLWRWLKDFVSGILDKLREKFTSLQTYAPIFTAAIKAIVSEISKQAGALFTDAVTTVAGVEKIIKGFGERIASAIAMNRVKLVQGYPSAVVDAIHRSMTLSGIEGLCQTARGVGGMALTTLAPVAAPIVSLVLNACEKLFRLLWRVAEIGEMKAAFALSREEYKRGKAYEAAIRDGKTADAPLHAQPMEFAKWFRAQATKVPVLACLTLTSGICGDKMTYLAMYNDDGKELDSKQFLKGAEGVDALKQWGSDYLAKSGYEFHTSDSFVSTMLKKQAANAENLRRGQQSTVGYVYDRAMTMVGARS
jgi:hypothetical protein